ncbi:MAG: hypothetical protein ACQEP3_02945 [Patescibacteria group bacterium]
MAKKSEVFEEFFFNELYQATERTLEKLSEEKGWKVEKYEDGETRKWIVQAVPELSLLKIHFLPKGAYKRLEITVSGHVVTAKCTDNWPSFTFDFLNQKKKIVKNFFRELKVVIKEDFGQ